MAENALQVVGIEAGCCAMRANTRSASTSAFTTASDFDAPYLMTPGSSGTSAIQRPSSSCWTIKLHRRQWLLLD